MNALAELLLRRINSTGPISVADYMTDCLLHPNHGYYTTRTPFGEAGDFTTAPEISQMFGELLGLGLAQHWLNTGQPDCFTLAELGPGRGTLMADILRATAKISGFHTAAQIVLLEASPTLRRKQRELLAGYEVTWIDTIQDLPQAPLFLIANEFFDALPIRQFSRDKNGWREHQIAAVDGKLSMGLSTPAPIAALDHRLAGTKAGDTVETRPSAAPIMHIISDRIATHGGAAIIVDYGDWRSLGDTFQAVRGHKPVSPLADPGQADVTAHVDFEALCSAAQNVSHTPMTQQSDLLNRLGIAARTEQLAQNLEGNDLHLHRQAHRRLTHPREMGTLFKAIALHQNGTNPPPGFEL